MKEAYTVERIYDGGPSTPGVLASIGVFMGGPVALCLAGAPLWSYFALESPMLAVAGWVAVNLPRAARTERAIRAAQGGFGVDNRRLDIHDGGTVFLAHRPHYDNPFPVTADTPEAYDRMIVDGLAWSAAGATIAQVETRPLCAHGHLCTVPADGLLLIHRHMLGLPRKWRCPQGHRPARPQAAPATQPAQPAVKPTQPAVAVTP